MAAGLSAGGLDAQAESHNTAMLKEKVKVKFLTKIGSPHAEKNSDAIVRCAKLLGNDPSLRLAYTQACRRKLRHSHSRRQAVSSLLLFVSRRGLNWAFKANVPVAPKNRALAQIDTILGGRVAVFVERERYSLKMFGTRIRRSASTSRHYDNA